MKGGLARGCYWWWGWEKELQRFVETLVGRQGLGKYLYLCQGPDKRNVSKTVEIQKMGKLLKMCVSNRVASHPMGKRDLR